MDVKYPNVQTSREQAVEIAAEVREEHRQHPRLPLMEALTRVLERRQIGTTPSPTPLQETRQEIPGSRFWGAARATALMPVVEKCRHEVFGSQKVPFESRAAAQRWMDARARWGSAKGQKEDLHRLERFMDEAYERLRALGPPPKPYRVSLQWETRTLGWGGNSYPVTDALITLKRHVEEIVQHTGWTEAETLDLVLLDVSPREEARISWALHVPPRGAGLTWLKDHPAEWQTFTIAGLRSWHLYRATFEGLAQQVRRWALFRGHVRDDLPLGDRLLLDSVVMVGHLPPPSRGQGVRVGRTEYWQQLRGAWVKLTGRRVRADALRKRLTRLEATRGNVAKMLEDVIKRRHVESQAHQKNRQDTSRRRNLEERSMKPQRRRDRGGNPQ